jgi:ribosomal protein S18 acetylase RimI-like enzyme
MTVDAPAIRGVLAEAYASDPLLCWIFAEEQNRTDAIAAWLGPFVEDYLGSGQVDVVSDQDEIAGPLWRMPGDRIEYPPLPSIAGLLAALIGARGAGNVAGSLHSIAGLTPEDSHAYLNFLAVRPALQGRGLGRTVIAPGIAKADSLEVGVHLESANPRNLPFYESFGFEVRDQIVLAPDGPKLWAMWRDPARR